jgi:protein TonB
VGLELSWERSDVLFRRALAASASLHLGLLLFGNLNARFEVPLPSPERVIDLSLPLGPRDRAAPGPLGRPGLPLAPAAAPPAPVSAPVAPVAAPAVPAAPAPALVPTADPRPAPPEPAVAPVPAVPPLTTTDPAAVGSPSGTSAGTPGATGGGGTGGPGMRTARPDVLPRLLNKEEVLKNLRKFYPEAERRAGREAKVIVRLRLGATGSVEAVDTLQSGGAAFDSAARSVAERMRFSPAMKDGVGVPVALPQVIEFRLE